MFGRMLVPVAFVLVVFGCETTNIAINQDVLAGVRTVAVLDFELAEGVPAVAGEEAMGVFQGLLLKAGFKVVERTRLAQVMAEKEFAQDMGDTESAVVLKSLVGADAVVFGKVLVHRQSRVSAVADDGSNYETDRYDYLIQVRMTATGDGGLVFDVKNTWTSHQNDPAFIPVTSMAQFRSQVHAAMEDELLASLRKARN